MSKLYRARSLLYRRQILQEKMRWKALAEIYTMASFAPFGVEMEKTPENHPVDPKNQQRKRWGKRSAGATTRYLIRTSAKRTCVEKTKKMKGEADNAIWYPLHRFGIRTGQIPGKPPRGPQTWGRKNAPGPKQPHTIPHLCTVLMESLISIFS